MLRPLAVLGLAALLQVLGSAAGWGEALKPATCRDDAMIVFDASGSMSGTDFNGPPTPRIAKVKQALARVLPSVASLRNLGLIDYGPGAHNRCDNIELQLEPSPNAAQRIMSVVDRLVPAGRTPLTSAVREAAKVLGFPAKPAVIVLLTDGEETCGGDPCGLARILRSKGENLTIHVIGYRARDSSEGMGVFQSRCLADTTGGLYISVETTEELVAALQKTLGCPAVSRSAAE
jgi:Ca-activated chloride channel family protein